MEVRLGGKGEGCVVILMPLSAECLNGFLEGRGARVSISILECSQLLFTEENLSTRGCTGEHTLRVHTL